MDDECLELQRSEMEALAAVYTADSGDMFAYSTGTSGMICGSIDVEVDANVCRQLIEASDTGDANWQHVDCLPPIRLNFTLPTTYPINAPPQTSLSCRWLSDAALDAIQRGLSDIWTAEQGMCVLGSFIDYMQHDIQPSSEIQIHLGGRYQTAMGYMARIRAYGSAKQRLHFKSQTHSCPICMEEQSGRYCMQLSCTHVFCIECLRGYLDVLVREGNILLMMCPHEECRASDEVTAISDSELVKLLSNEQMVRIRRLRNQRRTETDSTNYAMCARPGCNLVVRNDAQVDRLCVCKCGFTFCRTCRCTWHGVNRCEFKDVRELAEKYRQACIDEAEDRSSKERMYLEQRHGREIMRRYRTCIEDALSLEYIDANSVRCPKCKQGINKIFGCNHMTCSRCNTHFCYLCGSSLDSSQPMTHFSDSESSCFKKLMVNYEGMTDPDNYDAVEA
ncbi:hypothetical protein GGH12_000760 [Coemansia sp. RSA 1822]|nr:hypothetical protein LPJ76_001627 [Coemansia sp. RSA 638]KAJ2123742.1 hypothetical protein IW147_002335 [Coemansia sp. RSA 720]KAJ2544932.1 hypothetical protein GGF49_000842 [Coemansia sp. RSA 1853]KAJ2566606.1 hypothetical protein GGH12_000760 [Coemansia sp. RSA 1822]